QQDQVEYAVRPVGRVDGGADGLQVVGALVHLQGVQRPPPDLHFPPEPITQLLPAPFTALHVGYVQLHRSRSPRPGREPRYIGRRGECKVGRAPASPSETASGAALSRSAATFPWV